MSKLIIQFEHPDVMDPAPRPVGISAENVVTSGLGHDNGALLVGFGSQGAQRVEIFVDEARSKPEDVLGLAPTFVKNGKLFEWPRPVASIVVIEEEA